MAIYKTMQGSIIELTDKQWNEYPFNSSLMLIPDEVKTKINKSKEDNENGRRMVRKKHSM